MNSKQFGDYEQKRKTAYFFFLIILGKQKLRGIATETKSTKKLLCLQPVMFTGLGASQCPGIALRRGCALPALHRSKNLSRHSF